MSKTPEAPFLSLSGTVSSYAVMVKGRKKVFTRCPQCDASVLTSNMEEHSKKHKL